MVIGAAVVSVVIVAAWFPASALYHQHQQLASSSAQLAELRQQDKALNQERKNLSNSAEIERIARQQYGLVKPGQTAYQVLPASKGATGSGTDAPDPGDPGLTAPVAPSGDAELPAGSGHGAGSGATGAGSALSATGAGSGSTTATGSSGSGAGGGAGGSGGSTSGSSSVLGRIEQTLEFWR